MQLVGLLKNQRQAFASGSLVGSLWKRPGQRADLSRVMPAWPWSRPPSCLPGVVSRSKENVGGRICKELVEKKWNINLRKQDLQHTCGDLLGFVMLCGFAGWFCWECANHSLLHLFFFQLLKKQICEGKMFLGSFMQFIASASFLLKFSSTSTSEHFLRSLDFEQETCTAFNMPQTSWHRLLNRDSDEGRNPKPRQHPV